MVRPATFARASVFSSSPRGRQRPRRAHLVERQDIIIEKSSHPIFCFLRHRPHRPPRSLLSSPQDLEAPPTPSADAAVAANDANANANDTITPRDPLLASDASELSTRTSPSAFAGERASMQRSQFGEQVEAGKRTSPSVGFATASRFPWLEKPDSPKAPRPPSYAVPGPGAYAPAAAVGDQARSDRLIHHAGSRTTAFTLVPIRPRRRGERRSLRTFSPGGHFSPPRVPRFQSRHTAMPFNSASDAFRLHPDVASNDALNDPPQILAERRTCPRAAFGKAHRFATAPKRNRAPDPGTYPLPPSLGKQPDSTKETGATISFTRGSREVSSGAVEAGRDAPPSTRYTLKDSLTNSPYKSIAFTRDKRAIGDGAKKRADERDGGSGPGPGAFRAERSVGPQTRSGRRRAPSASFGTCYRDQAAKASLSREQASAILGGRMGPGPAVEPPGPGGLGAQVRRRMIDRSRTRFIVFFQSLAFTLVAFIDRESTATPID